jgi:Ca2+-binding RTX toxin-like protein
MGCIPRRRHAGFGLAAACFVVLVWPSLGRASTAAMTDGALTYSAAPGEANHLFIFQGPSGYRVLDSGATITPGAGCSAVSSEEIVCSIPDAPTVTGVTVSAGDMNDFVAVTSFVATNVFGEEGNDVLEVTSIEGPNSLDGGPGEDTLRAGDGFRDHLIGGAGADVLSGESRVFGFGGGLAIADYSERTEPVTADVDGVADDGEVGEGDNLVGIDTIIGGSGADTLTGGVVIGRGGNDTLLANDTLGGGGDPDRGGLARGGPGDDVLSSDGLGVVLGGGSGNDRLTAGASGFNELFAGGGNDLLIGAATNDDLSGGGGNDTLRGRGGSDYMTGEEGDDLLVGGRGRDSLGGGRGRDTFRARDGRPDRVNGGPDRDRARIDAALDTVSGVEVLL